MISRKEVEETRDYYLASPVGYDHFSFESKIPLLCQYFIEAMELLRMARQYPLSMLNADLRALAAKIDKYLTQWENTETDYAKIYTKSGNGYR